MMGYLHNLGGFFSSLAANNPSAVALRFVTGETVSYSALDALSNQMANYLLSRKISKGEVVAIFNDKSNTAISAMLACMKTGIIYTNLDANSPVLRLKKMIEIARPSLFFSHQKGISLLEESSYSHKKVVRYDTDIFLSSIREFPDTFPTQNQNVTGSTPAYLMFTSGSTGFPKGAIITHSNVLNFIQWSKATYSIAEADVFTNINPMHFDNSVFDFYSSLFSGASMVPVNEDLAKNPRKLLDALNRINPTIWFSVPSMLVYVLKMKALKESDLPRLRIVTFGGEGFPKSQLRTLWNFWGKRVKFINVYGPTECTCICSSFVVSGSDMESGELLPLGPIAPNFSFLILDQDKKEVGPGEVGELYIGGPNVGAGYYNNPEKTGESFIQNPLNKTFREIVYKSGDMVRYSNCENLLYFCGRRDNQVKRMGYRIELEEIESALGALNYIEENAVIFKKSGDDSGKIIACLRSSVKDENKIFTDLQKAIPAYMQPDEYRFFDHLPKNQNGKIDRLKLKNDIAQ